MFQWRAEPSKNAYQGCMLEEDPGGDGICILDRWVSLIATLTDTQYVGLYHKPQFNDPMKIPVAFPSPEQPQRQHHHHHQEQQQQQQQQQQQLLLQQQQQLQHQQQQHQQQAEEEEEKEEEEHQQHQHHHQQNQQHRYQHQQQQQQQHQQLSQHQHGMNRGRQGNSAVDDGHVSTEKVQHTAYFSQQVKELHMCDLTLNTNALGNDLWKLSQLSVLDLSRNLIDELPSGIGFLINLVVLDVSRNKLKELPKELGTCIRLREIRCQSNTLRPAVRSLPLKELGALKELVLIDLRFNKKLKSSSVIIRRHIVTAKILLNDPPPITKPHNIPQPPAVLDATLLQSQLEPLSTPQLRKRLTTVFNTPTNVENVDRASVIKQLLACYSKLNPPRKIVQYQGQSLDPKIVQDLIQVLRATNWQSLKRERTKVQSTGYLTLKRPPPPRGHNARPPKKTVRLAAEKLDQHQQLWTLAVAALESVDPVFAKTFSAIAVSKNFVGSPHIDSYDIDSQYAFSCGDFREQSENKNSGCLCVELNAHEVAHIDTYHRLGRVDGRYPHWVSPYMGERYSVIWFRTEGEPTPPTTAVLAPPPPPPSPQSLLPPLSLSPSSSPSPSPSPSTSP